MSATYNIARSERGEARTFSVPAAAKEAVALAYMPWGAATRGSIALGILKQCAKEIGFAPDVHYLNMKLAERVGFKLYEDISAKSSFSSEWFFSAALFGPQGLGLMENSWDNLRATETGRRMAERLSKLVGDSDDLCRKLAGDIVPAFIDECVESVEWSKYRVVGFSTTFAQTLASLLLARRIKDRHPQVAIVLGGANVDAEMGFEIIKAFGWVDYVVHGEAEKTFPELLRNIFDERCAEQVPGVSMRRGAETFAGFAGALPLKDLNESPVPDYTDYMKEVERTGLRKDLQIKLSFESSRGCWWGAKKHCTFCGLNGSTMAFRKKAPEKVYEEILHLTNRYRSLGLNAVDNIIDMGYFKELLPQLAEADLDLSIFYETKANLTKEQVRRLAAAGVEQIQPGIESFSTEILHLMRKGVTAIQNIQLLKWCFEYGIEPLWNILYAFPGERPEQYADYPRIFRLLFHLSPPHGLAPVVFERFSPYHFERDKFKLRLTPSPHYRMIYPESLVDYEKVAYFFEGDWEDREGDPEEYIKPTAQAYEEWHRHWNGRQVYFYYEKGPGFVTLYDNRPRGPGGELKTRIVTLNEIQTRVFLYCDEQRSFNFIQQMLDDSYAQAPAREQTRALLDRFVGHGFMFHEDDRYLSLAVRKPRGTLKSR